MARRIIVHGHVQGVFFRASMADLARTLGIHGWVRNDPGGTVTAHLEGDATAVETLLAWVFRGGPEAAAVEHVQQVEVEDTGASTFAVVR